MLLSLLNIVFTLLMVNNSAFEKDAEKFIRQNFSNYDKIEYTIQEDLNKYSKVEVNYGRAPNRIGNIFFLPVTVVDQYGLRKEKFLNINVRLMEEVVVASSKISKGEVVSSLNTELKTMDITELNYSPLDKTEMNKGFITKYDLTPNTVICNEHLEREPVLKVGDRVKAEYYFGSVEVTFEGTVRQDGAEGDIIKIKANNTQYSAVVIGSNRVKIIE